MIPSPLPPSIISLLHTPTTTLRILKVSEEDKSVPFRDPQTGLCQVAGPNEVGLIVNVVNNKVVQSRFDGYSDASATNKKLLTDVLVKGDCYFNSGDLLYRDEDGFYYWCAPVCAFGVRIVCAFLLLCIQV
jgi:acyl-CoA synthetase (AMP-forming)/AMP-acid ligase II